MYLACDGIADAGQFGPSAGARLHAIAERGLMLRDGSKFLSLAIPLGEYQPPRAAAARLHALLAHVDRRDRARVRGAFHVHQPRGG